MTVGILTKEPRTYDIKALISGFQALDVKVELIDYSVLSSHQVVDQYKHIDAILPRHTVQFIDQVTQIVSALEESGIYTPVSSSAMVCANSKFQTYQLLKRVDIPTPFTVKIDKPFALKKILDTRLTFPMIVKADKGSQGRSVYYVGSEQEFTQLLPVLHTYQGIVLQEYIQESHGEDIRVFVIGNKVVASMKRIAREGNLTSNFHQGGSVEPVVITEQENNLALLTAQAMNIELAGIDILRSEKGPLVIEVNDSPGYQGIEKATSIPVAAQVAEYIRDAASK